MSKDIKKHEDVNLHIKKRSIKIFFSELFIIPILTFLNWSLLSSLPTEDLTFKGIGLVFIELFLFIISCFIVYMPFDKEVIKK